MKRAGFSAYAAVLVVTFGILASPSLRQSNAALPRTVWFTPAPGSRDMLRLFQSPDEWAEVRARISVFEFYEGKPVCEQQGLPFGFLFWARTRTRTRITAPTPCGRFNW